LYKTAILEKNPKSLFCNIRVKFVGYENERNIFALMSFSMKNHSNFAKKQYNNHAATIYKWAQEDTDKTAPKKGIPDYSYSEEDSL